MSKTLPTSECMCSLIQRWSPWGGGHSNAMLVNMGDIRKWAGGGGLTAVFGVNDVRPSTIRSSERVRALRIRCEIG